MLPQISLLTCQNELKFCFLKQALEMQIKRTQLLMQSLEVSKACDNSIVEDTCKEIEIAFAKAATLLETRRGILQRKKDITCKMEVSLSKENVKPRFCIVLIT